MSDNAENGERFPPKGKRMITINMENLNLNDRDPNNLQAEIRDTQVFSDIFGEPDSNVFSFDRVWSLSYQTFTFVKLWSYRILTLILALPTAVCWGISFACVSFCSIWCCTPCIKCCRVEMRCCLQVIKLYADCCIAPFCIALGACFSNIRVRVHKDEHILTDKSRGDHTMDNVNLA